MGFIARCSAGLSHWQVPNEYSQASYACWQMACLYSDWWLSLSWPVDEMCVVLDSSLLCSEIAIDSWYLSALSVGLCLCLSVLSLSLSSVPLSFFLSPYLCLCLSLSCSVCLSTVYCAHGIVCLCSTHNKEEAGGRKHANTLVAPVASMKQFTALTYDVSGVLVCWSILIA